MTSLANCSRVAGPLYTSAWDLYGKVLLQYFRKWAWPRHVNLLRSMTLWYVVGQRFPRFYVNVLCQSSWNRINNFLRDSCLCSYSSRHLELSWRLSLWHMTCDFRASSRPTFLLLDQAFILIFLLSSTPPMPSGGNHNPSGKNQHGPIRKFTAVCARCLKLRNMTSLYFQHRQMTLHCKPLSIRFIVKAIPATRKSVIFSGPSMVFNVGTWP